MRTVLWLVGGNAGPFWHDLQPPKCLVIRITKKYLLNVRNLPEAAEVLAAAVAVRKINVFRILFFLPYQYHFVVYSNRVITTKIK